MTEFLRSNLCLDGLCHLTGGCGGDNGFGVGGDGDGGGGGDGSGCGGDVGCGVVLVVVKRVLPRLLR